MENLNELKVADITLNYTLSNGRKTTWKWHCVIEGEYVYVNYTIRGYINNVVADNLIASEKEEVMLRRKTMAELKPQIAKFELDEKETETLRETVAEYRTNTALNKKQYYVMKGWREGLAQTCSFSTAWYAENELHFENGLRYDKDHNRVLTSMEKINLEMYAACD